MKIFSNLLSRRTLFWSLLSSPLVSPLALGKNMMIGPIRRTTIIVNDMEQSIKFYRDLLGMKVYSEGPLRPSDFIGKLFGISDEKVKYQLVALRGEGSVVGTIGLFSILDPEGKPRQQEQRATSNIGVVIVPQTNMMGDEIEQLYQRMKDAGVNIICPPIERDVPGKGMSKRFTCLDPNGVMLEISSINVV